MAPFKFIMISRNSRRKNYGLPGVRTGRMGAEPPSYKRADSLGIIRTRETQRSNKACFTGRIAVIPLRICIPFGNIQPQISFLPNLTQRAKTVNKERTFWQKFSDKMNYSATFSQKFRPLFACQKVYVSVNFFTSAPGLFGVFL